jgi:uncharacterized delta-60 repeat protein
MRRAPLRPIAVLAALVAVLAAGPRRALGAAGDLDPAFGMAGKVTTAFPGFANASARALVIAPDGKITVAGAANTLTGSGFGIARYDASGALDPTFVSNGKLTIEIGTGFSYATAAAQQPDGSVVVAGQSEHGSERHVTAVRLLPDGSLDPAFGTGGIATVRIFDFPAINKALVQPDGRIVVVGSASIGSTDLLLVRWLPDGTLDPSFGTNGIRRIDLDDVEQHEAAADAILQADGGIVVVGFRSSFSSAGLIARFLPDGDLDTDFAVNGFRVVSGVSRLAGVVELPDGRLVATGSAGGDLALMRFDAMGTVDATFGTGGVATVPRPATFDNAWRVLLQPDGRYVVGGSTGSGVTADFIVARLEPSGTPDASFGTGGVATVDFAGDEDILIGFGRQADGRIVAAGQVRVGVPMFGVARLIGDPSCGDLLLDVGEDCDDGNVAAGDCCAPTCLYESVGSPCDDGNACTANDTCATGVCTAGPFLCNACEACVPATGCVAAPAPVCGRPTRPAGAKLVVDGPPGADHVVWSVDRGPGALLEDFGDPIATDDITLCLYDETAPVPRRVFAATAPAGGTCGRSPCWRTVGGGAFRYRDPAGAAGGLRTILFRSGPYGFSSAVVRARGRGIGVPPLPLALPVRVQLRSESGFCWEAVHAAPGVIRSDGGGFVGRGE